MSIDYLEVRLCKCGRNMSETFPSEYHAVSVAITTIDQVLVDVYIHTLAIYQISNNFYGM